MSAEPPVQRPSEAAIAQMIHDGRVAHPELAPTTDFGAFVSERAAAILAAREPAARAGDVYLAAACAAADPLALARLDATMPEIVRPALARLGLPASDDDEIIQRVRVALFAPPQGAARGIAGYSGRGDLRAYVRAVAVRLALKRIEREEAASPEDDSEVISFLSDGSDSPELRLLKERCRGELRGAFATALAELEPRQRTLLRQHYLDGLTVDALGRLHRVHGSTCARWIEAARVQILTGVRRYLRQQLGLGPAELESAVALVRSQLDLSLSRQLPRLERPSK